MPAPRRGEQPGDRGARCLGESGGAAGLLQAASVVPAEQQRAGSAREPVTAPETGSVDSLAVGKTH